MLEPGTHQSKADVFNNAALSGVQRRAQITRENAGLRPGQASVPTEKVAKPAQHYGSPWRHGWMPIKPKRHNRQDASMFDPLKKPKVD